MESRRSGLYTTGFAGIAHAYAHLFILLYATVVLVLEREWQLSYAQLSALSLPSMVMFGAAALPAGWLGDRWSSSGMIAVFFFGVGGSSILTGLADGPITIALGLTLIGTFAAIYHPVGIPWLVRHAVSRGRALGINGVFGSAGTAGAALVAGFTADLFGWRAAFILPGAVALATGLVFLIALRRGAIVERREDAAPQPAPVAADIKRAFVVLSVTMLCSGMIYQSTSFALPKIFEERLSTGLGGSVFGIGGLVTLCYAAGALSQVIGGELADRFNLRTLYATALLLQMPVLAIAFLLHSPALVPAAALMIALNVTGQPAENALLARYTPLKWRGRAFGAKFVLTLGVSAFGVALVPVLHGLTGSLDILFIALFVFAGVATVAATRLPDSRAPAPTMVATPPAVPAE